MIELLELAGDRVGLVFILREQELHSPNRVPQPARRIEPRREYETDSAGRELLSIKAGGPQQRAHSNVARIGQHLETVADENAILTAERRDVRNRRQRDKIQHRPYEVVVGAELAGESEGELEGYADGGEVLIRISVARPLGIENREAIRQLTTWKVVVGDDDVDSRSAEPRDGSNRSGAAVARDHDLCFRRDRGVDSGIAQVISVLDPTGNERHRLPAQSTDHAREDRRGADAVHIVVAVDKDQLLLAHSARQALDGFVHREEAEGIVEPIELRTQEELRLLGRHVTSDEQQPADDFRQRQRRHERSDRFFVRGFGKNPARKSSWPVGRDRRHPTSAYNSTPQASHTSISPVPAIMFRRWSGMEVSQFPHEPPRNAYSAITLFPLIRSYLPSIGRETAPALPSRSRFASSICEMSAPRLDSISGRASCCSCSTAASACFDATIASFISVIRRPRIASSPSSSAIRRRVDSTCAVAAVASRIRFTSSS